MGIPVGGGTDAHRVMSYNPFVSLQWMLDGKTVGGIAMRAPEEMPTRIEALRLYTEGSAWFAFDENARGALAAGKLADLAVLSKDYLTVPTDEIGAIVSLLTMVGGRIVYADGPFAAYEDKPRADRSTAPPSSSAPPTSPRRRSRRAGPLRQRHRRQHDAGDADRALADIAPGLQVALIARALALELVDQRELLLADGRRSRWSRRRG